jgi:hypothetical protein
MAIASTTAFFPKISQSFPLWEEPKSSPTMYLLKFVGAFYLVITRSFPNTPENHWWIRFHSRHFIRPTWKVTLPTKQSDPCPVLLETLSEPKFVALLEEGSNVLVKHLTPKKIVHSPHAVHSFGLGN